MLAALRGVVPPLPPDVPGRRHVCADLPDDESAPPPGAPPGLTAERVAVLELGLTDAEAGALLGLSRQRVFQLRRRLAGITTKEPAA